MKGTFENGVFISHNEEPNKIKVELTQSEIENLADLIEFEFIDILRRDTSIDNIDYVASMMNAYQELKKYTTNKENTNHKPYLSCDMDNKSKGEY